MRCLDTHQANPGPDSTTWNGDALEFYFDTRQGDALRGKDWTSARFISISRRSARGDQTALGGARRDRDERYEAGRRRTGRAQTKSSYELELKIPWRNFPGFAPNSAR